jgi:hypothetical protein
MALAAAREHRSELQKVLDHYSAPEDSLRLEAAEFLIENMRFGYSYGGDQLDRYDSIFPKFDSIRHPDGIRQLFTEFAKTHGPLVVEDLQTYADLRHVTADYLIHNIERAFWSWENYPWSKNVPFDLFKKAVLPYRIDNEPLEDWRSEYQQKFRWMLDTLSDPADMNEVFGFLNRDLIIGFLVVLDWDYPIRPRQSLIERYRIGTCGEEATLLVSAMRALGIPAAKDFLPRFANTNVGHNWAALLHPDGHTYWFFRNREHYPRKDNPVPASISRWPVQQRPYYRHMWAVDTLKHVPKVYRQYQSISGDPLFSEIQAYPGELVPLFSNPTMADVTHLYLPDAADVTVHVRRKPPDMHLAYLALFELHGNEASFNPVAVANIESTTAHFRDMGQNVVYFPVGSHDGDFAPIGYPFIIIEGMIRHFIPNPDTGAQATLYRKRNLMGWIVRHAGQMLGGRFEVANLPDFTDSRTIYSIDSTPMYMTEISLDLKEPYRYARYVTPDNSQGDIAELEFWGEEGRITGKPIGARGRLGNELENLDDGDWDSYFAMEKRGKYWVGFDFGQPVKLEKLRFCPRNDTNMIMPGNRYELFYWDWGWKSLGQQVATGMKLEYDSVPQGALLWLHNHSGGNEENVFIMEDGVQRFF